VVIDVQRLLARVLVVIFLASFGGLGAWYAYSGKTPLYERKVSLVVVPDRKLGPSEVPIQVDTTIAGGIGSKAMLGQALRELRFTPASAKDYSLRAFVRPGSDIIDAQLRGPDPRVLAPLGRAYVRTSTRWSSDHYAAYDLEFLETTATPGPVYPHPKRMYGLGLVLGGLLGLLVVYLESHLTGRYRLRRRLFGGLAPESESAGDEPAAGPTPPHSNGEPVRQLGGRRARPQDGSAGARRRRRRANG
jgi:hypothetical protein